MISGEAIPKKIYDMAVEAGTSLKKYGVKKDQLEKLIQVYLNSSDRVSSLMDLIVFVSRQVGRGPMKMDPAKIIVKHLNEFREKYGHDPNLLDFIVQKYLYLTKWVYESEVKRFIRKFDEFVIEVLR
jgi:hypothetical protein